MMTNVEINKQAPLSEHFTLGEMCKTSARTPDGNIPSHTHIENLKRLCRWLELLRTRYNMMYGTSPFPSKGGESPAEHGATAISSPLGRSGEVPIIINSAYRSPQVNKAVGGVATSNHLTGCAADIRVYGQEQLIRYACILLDISDETRDDFDELLLERSPRGTYWLHFAVRPPEQGNRRKIRFIQT